MNGTKRGVNMSEERFELVEAICYEVGKQQIEIMDNLEKQILDKQKIADLLNEQQATISKQLDQIIELQDKYRILEFNRSRLEKRNKAQYEKIDEQQTIINKLKEENEQLKEEIEPLKQKEEVLNEIWRNYLETHKYGRFNYGGL